MILEHYPKAQAIYLFGSYGTEQEWPESDVDIALLLPAEEAKKTGNLMMGDRHFALESLLKKDVDLINLRRDFLPTVRCQETLFWGQPHLSTPPSSTSAPRPFSSPGPLFP